MRYNLTLVRMAIIKNSANNKCWRWLNTAMMVKDIHIWVSSNNVDEPRAYYIEWSKSEREKQIPYIKAYIWNLERWYWWNYLQSSNQDTGRRQWQPTPVLLPGKSHGRGSLVGCRLWGRKVGHDWSDLAAAAAIKTQTQKPDFWTWGWQEEGEGGIYGDSNMESYITICKTHSQWEFAVWLCCCCCCC